MQTKIKDEIVPLLQELILETEVGVIDYKSKALRDSEPEDIDVTHEMVSVCRSAAEKVQRLMTVKKKEVMAADSIEDLNQ